MFLFSFFNVAIKFFVFLIWFAFMTLIIFLLNSNDLTSHRQPSQSAPIGTGQDGPDHSDCPNHQPGQLCMNS